MAKVKFHSVNKKEKRQIIGDLFEVLSSLKTKQEIIDFQIGLLTPSEVLMIARRIQIAKMLIDGESYEKIRRRMKVSHMTIGRIERWLLEDESRNKFVIKKIERLVLRQKTEKKTKSSGKDPNSMLDKYAHYRFLKNLLGL